MTFIPTNDHLHHLHGTQQIKKSALNPTTRFGHQIHRVVPNHYTSEQTFLRPEGVSRSHDPCRHMDTASLLIDYETTLLRGSPSGSLRIGFYVDISVFNGLRGSEHTQRRTVAFQAGPTLPRCPWSGDIRLEQAFELECTNFIATPARGDFMPGNPSLIGDIFGRQGAALDPSTQNRSTVSIDSIKKRRTSSCPDRLQTIQILLRALGPEGPALRLWCVCVPSIPQTTVASSKLKASDMARLPIMISAGRPDKA
jgi:hypothetical protein